MPIPFPFPFPFPFPETALLEVMLRGLAPASTDTYIPSGNGLFADRLLRLGETDGLVFSDAFAELVRGTRVVPVPVPVPVPVLRLFRLLFVALVLPERLLLLLVVLLLPLLILLRGLELELPW